MKAQLAIAALACSLVVGGSSAASAQIGGALRGFGKKAVDKATEKKTPDPEPTPEPAKPEPPASPAPEPEPVDAQKDAPATAAPAPTYKAYQNYDFVPGDKIVFDDNFRADQDGEFAAHWKLVKGQAVVNKLNGEPIFALTEGNYVIVAPRVTVPSYLSDPFTIEADFYPSDGGYQKILFFLKAGDKETTVIFGSEVGTENFEEGSANQSARFPGGSEGYTDKWHHLALVVKGGQLKAYQDQYRVLVIPDIGTFKAESVSFGGIGEPDHPIVFKNVRIANGGGMTMIDKLTKDGKIVTHGIQFDVNKSVVKPESMGTIQQIVALLKSNAAIKFEIGGYTDSDGDAAKNVTLSEARANAVKQLVVDQGIDASRLTAKGYGATKPIDANTTPEGKANNRRVEFVKQ